MSIELPWISNQSFDKVDPYARTVFSAVSCLHLVIVSDIESIDEVLLKIDSPG